MGRRGHGLAHGGGLLVGPAPQVDQQPANHAKPSQAKSDAQAAAGDDQPAVLRAVTKVLRAGAKVVRGVIGAVRWLVDLWRQASQKTAPANGEAMAAPLPSLPPSAPAIGRFGS